ncbi:MAG TPA: hypothetical protein VF054_05115 [Micromonosporaceae bacterium]
MTSRRWAVSGLLAIASLSLVAVSGCGPTGMSADATPSPKSPKDTLVAATTALASSTYSFTVTGNQLKGSGAIDAPARSGTFSLSVLGDNGRAVLKLDYLSIGPQAWVRMDFGALKDVPGIANLPDKWLHIDVSKIDTNSIFGLDATGQDPADAAQLVAAVADVRKVDDTHYQGTIDVGKAKQSALLGPGALDTVAASAKAVPFEAALDSQGRLTDLKITLPASGDRKQNTIEVTYTNYGVQPTLTPPPSDAQIEAPSSVYDMLTKK